MGKKRDLRGVGNHPQKEVGATKILSYEEFCERMSKRFKTFKKDGELWVGGVELREGLD